jgi:hypothetical protein
MMDITYYIKDGVLYKDEENDGATFLRRGPERHTTPLCSVEEAKEKYPSELERAMRPNDALR